MTPLIFEHGRSRLLYSDDTIRMDMDGGNGLVMRLSNEEMKALSRALWHAAKPAEPFVR